MAAEEGIELDADSNGELTRAELKAGMQAYCDIWGPPPPRPAAGASGSAASGSAASGSAASGAKKAEKKGKKGPAAAAATVTDAELAEAAADMEIDISKLPLKGKAAKQLIADAKEAGITLDTDANGKVSKKELKAGLATYKAMHPEEFEEDSDAEDSDGEDSAEGAAPVEPAAPAAPAAPVAPAAPATPAAPVAATTAAAQKKCPGASITDAELTAAAAELEIDISSLPVKGKAAKELIAGAKAEGIALDTDGNGKISKKELKAGLAAYKAANPTAFAPPAATTTAATTTAAAQKKCAGASITDAELTAAAAELEIDISSLPVKGKAAKELIAGAKAEGIALDTDGNGKISKKELKAGLAAYKAANPTAFAPPAAPAAPTTTAAAQCWGQ